MSDEPVMAVDILDLDELEQRAKTVSKEEAWFRLEGRVFGAESTKPLKVKLASGEPAWGTHFTRGLQEYARTLKGAARRRFQINSQSIATLDQPAVLMGTREAIQETGIILALGVAGPELEDPREPLPADLRKVYGVDVFPPEIQGLFKRRVDGMWLIPTQTEPPAGWVAKPEQIVRLLRFNEFINQVGAFRRMLVDEGVETEEDELGN